MKRVGYRVARAAWRVACRHGWWTLGAWALTRLTETRAPGHRRRVLVLSKTVFNQDIEAVIHASSDLTFLLFPRLLLNDLVRRHVADFELLNDASYHPLMDGTVAQERVRADVRALVDVLRAKLDFHVIVAGNFVYVSQQELFVVAAEVGIPVVVLYKEGMIPVGKYTHAASVLYGTKRFLGTTMLFYNTHIREAVLRAGLPGLLPERTQVVGVPRLDGYGPAQQSPDQRHLVLFAFSATVKASYLVPDPASHAEFTRRVEQFQADFVRYAAEHPDVQLTIKTKTAPAEIAACRNMLNQYGWEHLPPNVSLVASGSSKSLIQQATAVAGYSSTTLLEALLCEVPVLCPALADLFGPSVPVDYFDAVPDAVGRPDNYTELCALLDRPEALPRPRPDQALAVLEPVIFRADGKAGARVAAALHAEIDRHQPRVPRGHW